MEGATLRLRLLLISSIKQIGKLDGPPSRPSRPLSSWTKEEVGRRAYGGGHEHMMSALAGFAMVRKLCKGGCVKMQARGEGSMKCCLPLCMAPYHIFTSKWARAVRMSGVGGTISRTGEVAPALFKVKVNESMLRVRYERREFSEMFRDFE